MKVLILLTGFCLLSSVSIERKQSTNVYYCDSVGGMKYHFKKECRGLQKCTHTIRETTVEGAKKLELTVCLIEKSEK